LRTRHGSQPSSLSKEPTPHETLPHRRDGSRFAHCKLRVVASFLSRPYNWILPDEPSGGSSLDALPIGTNARNTDVEEAVMAAMFFYLLLMGLLPFFFVGLIDVDEAALKWRFAIIMCLGVGALALQYLHH
jgi:hypothetical protein